MDQKKHMGRCCGFDVRMSNDGDGADIVQLILPRTDISRRYGLEPDGARELAALLIATADMADAYNRLNEPSALIGA